MCQQFQITNQDPAINGIVWDKLDVISDQRMRLRNLMAVVPEDLGLLINEDVPGPFVGYVRDVGKHLMGSEDDLSGILSRIEKSGYLRRNRAASQLYPDGTRDIAAHQVVCLVPPRPFWR